AISIMEAVSASNDGVGVSEVARHTGLPKSTAARILTDLAGADVLDRVRDHYFPGTRMLAMAERADPAGAVVRRRLVQPHLERLRDETGLAVAFSTLRYGQVRVEAALHVPSSIDIVSSVPKWAPAHCTCSGK